MNILLQLELCERVGAALDDNFPSGDLLGRVGPQRGKFLVVGPGRVAPAQVAGRHPLVPSELRRRLIRRKTEPGPRIERRKRHPRFGNPPRQLIGPLRAPSRSSSALPRYQVSPSQLPSADSVTWTSNAFANSAANGRACFRDLKPAKYCDGIATLLPSASSSRTSQSPTSPPTDGTIRTPRTLPAAHNVLFAVTDAASIFDVERRIAGAPGPYRHRADQNSREKYSDAYQRVRRSNENGEEIKVKCTARDEAADHQAGDCRGRDEFPSVVAALD